MSNPDTPRKMVWFMHYDTPVYDEVVLKARGYPHDDDRVDGIWRNEMYGYTFYSSSRFYPTRSAALEGYIRELEGDVRRLQERILRVRNQLS